MLCVRASAFFVTGADLCVATDALVPVQLVLVGTAAADLKQPACFQHCSGLYKRHQEFKQLHSHSLTQSWAASEGHSACTWNTKPIGSWGCSEGPQRQKSSQHIGSWPCSVTQTGTVAHVCTFDGLPASCSATFVEKCCTTINRLSTQQHGCPCAGTSTQVHQRQQQLHIDSR